jgi:hypothetical protein
LLGQHELAIQRALVHDPDRGDVHDAPGEFESTRIKAARIQPVQRQCADGLVT